MVDLNHVVRDTLAGFNTGLHRLAFGPGPGVLADCPEPLRSLYLQPLLAGEKRAGFAFTEPHDAQHFTRAVPSALPVTTRVPSGVKAAVKTSASWPRRTSGSAAHGAAGAVGPATELVNHARLID